MAYTTASACTRRSWCAYCARGQRRDAAPLIETTVGRIIFNEPIPQDLGYVDRTDPEHMFDLEVSFHVGKKQLGKIIDRCIEPHGFTVATEVLDTVKALGYKYSTIGAITVAPSCDMTVPEKKTSSSPPRRRSRSTRSTSAAYHRGRALPIWPCPSGRRPPRTSTACRQPARVQPDLYDGGLRRPWFMDQIRQLAGMRGLMANTSGKTIEMPDQGQLP